MIKLQTIWTERKRIANERMKICESCEHENEGICDKCGCIIAVKAMFPCSECPLGKWKEKLDNVEET